MLYQTFCLKKHIHVTDVSLKKPPLWESASSSACQAILHLWSSHTLVTTFRTVHHRTVFYKLTPSPYRLLFELYITRPPPPTPISDCVSSVSIVTAQLWPFLYSLLQNLLTGCDAHHWAFGGYSGRGVKLTAHLHSSIRLHGLVLNPDSFNRQHTEMFEGLWRLLRGQRIGK